ncbi:MAG: hypothetical protein ABR585_01690 [Gemmatimonadaceae bacterium]
MFKARRSTSLALCLSAVFLGACAKKDNAATDTMAAMDTTAAATSPAPAAAPFSLADVAGNWNMKSSPTTGDTTPTTYVLKATSTTSGWTITFPGRKPVTERVRVDGDSIMVSAGPYESVRRKGVQVVTDGVLRLQGGGLVGNNTAHYRVKTADSVLKLNTQGTRAK